MPQFIDSTVETDDSSLFNELRMCNLGPKASDTWSISAVAFIASIQHVSKRVQQTLCSDIVARAIGAKGYEGVRVEKEERLGMGQVHSMSLYSFETVSAVSNKNSPGKERDDWPDDMR